MTTLMNRTIMTTDGELFCIGTRTIWAWDKKSCMGWINHKGHVWKVVAPYNGKIATVIYDEGPGRATNTGAQLAFVEVEGE